MIGAISIGVGIDYSIHMTEIHKIMATAQLADASRASRNEDYVRGNKYSIHNESNYNGTTNLLN